jgi:hypothetical protein
MARRNRDIRQRRIQNKFGPLASENIVPEEMEIRDIPGKGLFLVVKHNNKVRYLQWDDSPSGKTVDVKIPVALTNYDAEPARTSVSNIHGGLLSLDTGGVIDPVPTTVTVSKGIGKVLIVVNAGSDLVGSITVTGESIDRETGASTLGDTDVIAIDGLTTDGSGTDANLNAVYAFENAYISSKWFTGTVVLSSSTVTLTDVDTYHVSFEQFNDTPNILLETFDANIYTTNASAEFDAYLYSLTVDGSVCAVTREADLNVGTIGETALANKYWRLRKGNINKELNGLKDGVWVDIHYANSPAYVEDATVKVWVTKTQTIIV